MIHQYRNNGYNIVMDVESGSVHVVDDLVYDMIAILDEHSNDHVLRTVIDDETIEPASYESVRDILIAGLPLYDENVKT